MPSLGDLTEAEKKQLAGLREAKGEYDVSDEYMMLAELGLYFGWPAIQSVVNNEVKDISMVIEIIKAARKLKGRQ